MVMNVSPPPAARCALANASISRALWERIFAAHDRQAQGEAHVAMLLGCSVDLRHDVGACVVLDVGQDNDGALLRQSKGTPTTDTRGAAGDDRDRSCDSITHLYPSSGHSTLAEWSLSLTGTAPSGNGTPERSEKARSPWAPSFGGLQHSYGYQSKTRTPPRQSLLGVVSDRPWAPLGIWDARRDGRGDLRRDGPTVLRTADYLEQALMIGLLRRWPATMEPPRVIARCVRDADATVEPSDWR